MSRNRLVAAAAVAAATVAMVSLGAVTHHGAVAAPVPSSTVSLVAYTTTATVAKVDPKILWLGSAGGQAQVTFNQDVDAMAGDLETEAHAPTVANHLAFEADARVMRAEARKILSAPALLPHHNRAAYKRMLQDFVTVANLLQPGPGYGTTAQDYTAWWKALGASNLQVW